MDKKRAFTLVELLLVIAIIVILISLLLVGYRTVNTLLKEKSCQNNLAKIGVILNHYCQQNRGFYPDVDGCGGFFFRNTMFNGAAVTSSWTALSNVRELKDMGATDALFTCPFSVTPNPLPDRVGTFDSPTTCTITIGGKAITGYEVDLTSYSFLFGRGGNFGNLSVYSGNPDQPGTLNTFADGRMSPITNSCKGNTPIVADILSYDPADGWAAGWFHGGGLASGPGLDPVLFFQASASVFYDKVPSSCWVNPVSPFDSPGLPPPPGTPSNNHGSSCNTLFAGGNVVHSEPSEFENSDGTLNTTYIPMITDVPNGSVFSPNYNYFALQPTTR